VRHSYSLQYMHAQTAFVAFQRMDCSVSDGLVRIHVHVGVPLHKAREDVAGDYRRKLQESIAWFGECL